MQPAELVPQALGFERGSARTVRDRTKDRNAFSVGTRPADVWGCER